MSRFLALFTCATLAALSTGAWTAAGATQTRSVWSGVYSAEQANRGRRLYVRDCAECHAENLMGAEGGSELVGAAFLSRWEKTSVGALYDLVRKTMPDASPGSLTERQYLDIIAYLLKENAFPAGQEELPTTLDAMTSIRIEPKPQAPSGARP